MGEPLRLTVLREILRYVRAFRDRIFVIAFDGALLEQPGFTNLLQDLALLHSINIRPVVVVELAAELQRRARLTGQPVRHPHADGPVSGEELAVVEAAGGAVANALLSGLCSVDLPAAVAPALVAHPAGIRKGVDWQWAGRIDRADGGLLLSLLEQRIVPVVLPLGFDGEGHAYLVNADEAAAEIAVTLRAAKLLFVTTASGIEVEGRLLRQLRLDDAEALLNHGPALPPGLHRKLRCACHACKHGVERVHVVNGLVEEGLLAEVFSAEGVGTLIHRDEYAAIRRAAAKDASEIYRLLQPAMETEELLPRTLEEVRAAVERFFVYDLDGTIVGCVAVIPYPERSQVEIACLAVDAAHENRGIGRRLVEIALREAQRCGAAEAFVLTTQAANYFRSKVGFTEASAAILPPERRARWEQSGRNSLVLRRALS